MRVLILLLTALFCYGQTANDDGMTGNLTNGRAWLRMQDGEHVVYIIASHDSLVDTLSTTYTTAAEVNRVLDDRWVRRATYGDYVQELDNLYKDRENVRIPITIALRYCTLKLRGNLTKQELERRLIDLRGRF